MAKEFDLRGIIPEICEKLGEPSPENTSDFLTAISVKLNEIAFEMVMANENQESVSVILPSKMSVAGTSVSDTVKMNPVRGNSIITYIALFESYNQNKHFAVRADESAEMLEKVYKELVETCFDVKLAQSSLNAQCRCPEQNTSFMLLYRLSMQLMYYFANIELAVFYEKK